MRPLTCIFFLAVFTVAGCGGNDTGESTGSASTSGDDAGTLDTGEADTKDPPADTDPGSPYPEEATLVVPALGEGPQIYESVIAEGEYHFAAPLEGDQVLAQNESEVQRIDELTAQALAVDIDPGSLQLLVAVDSETIMVLADGGLFALVDSTLMVSPLGEFFEGQKIQSMATANSELWMATESELHLWRDGMLYPVESDDLLLESPQLSFGPAIDGQSALWLANGSTLLAVVENEEGLEIWTEREELSLSSIVSDSLGQLWGLSEGDVHQRDANGKWYWWRFDSPVVAIAASPLSSEVWFLLETQLWRHLDGQFRMVMDNISFSAGVADGTGRLLGVNGGNVLRVTPGEEPEPVKVTWSKDIVALSTESCGPCHGPKGQGGQPLHTIEHWTEKIDSILFMVSNGNMPLDPYPKLTNTEIATIQVWKEQGFLE